MVDEFFCLLLGMDVAHETLVFGTLHSAALEEAAVLLGGKVGPVFLGHLQQGLAWLEEGLFVWGGEAVPGAGRLAAVATINIIAHGGLGIGG